jgi:hypothetical protein
MCSLRRRGRRGGGCEFSGEWVECADVYFWEEVGEEDCEECFSSEVLRGGGGLEDGVADTGGMLSCGVDERNGVVGRGKEGGERGFGYIFSRIGR